MLKDYKAEYAREKKLCDDGRYRGPGGRKLITPRAAGTAYPLNCSKCGVEITDPDTQCVKDGKHSDGTVRYRSVCKLCYKTARAKRSAHTNLSNRKRAQLKANRDRSAGL